MANIGEYSNQPVIQLYNMIPTAGVAGTARVTLVDAGGKTVAENATITIAAAASNLYFALVAVLGATIVDGATGGTIVPSVEVRYNTSGAVGSTVNAPVPTAATASYWSAGVEYYFGVIAVR